MNIKTPKFYYQNTLFGVYWEYCLYPFSLLYIVFYIILYYTKRNWQYKFDRLEIICIGNITMGGSGKTEIAAAIGREMNMQGRQFCFLTRGYGRVDSQDTFLPLGYNMIFGDEYLTYGDEPILLTQTGDVFISSNRKNTLTRIQSLGYDAVIMDDGLHDPTIYKNKTIITFDSKSLIGNGKFFPAGPLRAPFFLFSNKVDEIIFTNATDNYANIKISNQLKCQKVKMSKIIVKNPGNYDRVVAFSGIAINEKFFSTVSDSGYIICDKIEFPDHHRYTEADFIKILNVIKENKADFAITTSKDFIKIPLHLHQIIQPLIIYHDII